MSRYGWLKIHTEILEDPKISALGDTEFRIWIELLVMAREGDGTGLIARTCAQVAWRLRRPPTQVSEAVAHFASAGMVTTAIRDGHECFFVTNFAKRQGRHEFPSDAKEATRQRKRDSRAGVTSRSRLVKTPLEESRVEESRVDKSTSGGGGPKTDAPPPEWPEDLREVQEALRKLQAPLDLIDEQFWRSIDEWIGSHPRIFYLDQLAAALAWERAQPPAKRKKNHRAFFRNWLATEERKDGQAQQRQHQLQAGGSERPRNQPR